MDLILEATGVPSLAFNLLDGLATNGIYVLTGIPGGDRPISVDGAGLMRQLVLRNQVMIGSVNASRAHFQMGVDDLAKAREKWGSTVDQVITHRFPFDHYLDAYHAIEASKGEYLKVMIELA